MDIIEEKTPGDRSIQKLWIPRRWILQLEHLCNVWRRLEAIRSILEAINICIISAFFGVYHIVDLIGNAYNVTYKLMWIYGCIWTYFICIMCIYICIFIPCTKRRCSYIQVNGISQLYMIM